MRSVIGLCAIACALSDVLVTPTRAADQSMPVTHVRVNQVGFHPGDIKTAVVFGERVRASTFAVLNVDGGPPVLEGSLERLVGRWGAFDEHHEADFSTVRKPGRYRIQVGDARSPVFAIADDVSVALPDRLLDYMRQQRCGYNPWLDAVCHRHDGRTAFGPMPDGTWLDASGGWHDAGDLLKYLLTSSNATAQLLLAYRLSPRAFDDRVNTLGQAQPNGIADVLDEARWGLEWMLKLHPAPDQLFHQVADDRDHAGWRLPQNESVDYGWGAGRERVVYFAAGKPQGLKQYQSESTGVANLAGRYAAAMALAYQIWRDEPAHRAFAARCLQGGREVYALGRRQEGVQQGNSYGAPYRYEERTWADDMEWGAAELHRATRERRYLDDAIRYARVAAATSWMGKPTARHYEFYPFMNAGHFRLHDLVRPAVRKELAAWYREGLEATAAKGAGNPYRVGVPFIWCSNNLVVALVTQGLMYERMTGDRRFVAHVAAQRDWLLGRNPWGTSMLTGIPDGGEFPTDVHLMTTQLTRRSVVGGLVDGPVERRIFASLKGVSITEPDPLVAFQDDRAVYHDDVKDYSTNEPTMDGTASAILMWALANQQPAANRQPPAASR